MPEVDVKDIKKEIDDLCDKKLLEDHYIESAGDLDNLIDQKEDELEEPRVEVELLRSLQA
jgi:hypothetical protein